MCEQPSKRQAKREKLLMHRNYSKSGELRPRRIPVYGEYYKNGVQRHSPVADAEFETRGNDPLAGSAQCESSVRRVSRNRAELGLRNSGCSELSGTLDHRIQGLPHVRKHQRPQTVDVMRRQVSGGSMRRGRRRRRSGVASYGGWRRRTGDSGSSPKSRAFLCCVYEVEISVKNIVWFCEKIAITCETVTRG